MKKYRLVWIRSLMLLSIAMLLALLTSWLFSQYKEQKTLLVKDLNASLTAAQDKQLYSDYVQPALKNAEVYVDSLKHIFINKKFKVKQHGVSIKINTDEKDSLTVLQIGNGINRLSGMSDSTVILNHKDNKRVLFHSDGEINNDSLKNNLKPVLELILKHALESATLSEDTVFKVDKVRIKKEFEKTLTKHGQHFKIVWDSAKKYYITQNQKPILLERSIAESTYAVAIDNYSLYLLTMIVSQILFVFFLLGVTVTAFLFTYNTLKAQIRLGIIKNDLISNMSHELKTPISTVKVALEAISNFNPITDNATTRDYLYMASLEMERLEMLVNQSLNTSLLEEGKMILRREPYNVQQLVERTLHAMQVRFKQTNTEVNVTNTAINTQTHIDILQMQGVLVNLLDNSIKYGGSAPVIHINIAEDEKHLILSVTDNGPGIPEEYISKVFDKFFRVPTGDVHNVKGYGLGLSYVKQVVNQHYGSITVENQDRGCVFTIKLPKTI